MARYNVQHPETKQWRCFSSIIDNYITDWMNEEQYEQWRKFEYGETNFSPVRESNLMDFNEAERIVNDKYKTIIKEVIIESNETGYHIYEKPYWCLGKIRQGLLQTLHTYEECLEWLKNEYGDNYKIVKQM